MSDTIIFNRNGLSVIVHEDTKTVEEVFIPAFDALSNEDQIKTLQDATSALKAFFTKKKEK